ncbi:hypothetical protein [Sphingomonas sp. VNH70]|jgi:hypothetical protein
MLGYLDLNPRDCMVAVSLRQATHADAAALGALHVASWHETYTGLVPGEMLAGLSVDARTAMWGNILKAPDEYGCTAVVIAENHGCVVGFGSCGKQRDASLTGKGFSGEFAASLWVLRGNAPARAFYEKLGGIVVDEKIDGVHDAALIEDAYGWRDLSSLGG